MELLYVWVEEYKNIKRQGFNFSREYDIDFNYENNELDIEKKKNPLPEEFFGKNISNINVIVGKNGSGKSTVLDFIKNFRDKFDEKIGFIVYKKGDKKFYVSRGEITVNTELENVEVYNEFSIIFYSDFINGLNRGIIGTVHDISSESIINSWTEHKGQSQVENYKYDDMKKQITFLAEKNDLVKKLPFKEYIEKLRSIDSVIIKFKKIDYESEYNIKTTNYETTEKTVLYKRFSEILLVKENEPVNKIKNAILLFLIDRVVKNIVHDKIDEKQILNGIEKEDEKRYTKFTENIVESKKKYNEAHKTGESFGDLEFIDYGFINELLNMGNSNPTKIRIKETEIQFEITDDGDIKIKFRKGSEVDGKFTLFFEEIKSQRISEIINLDWNRKLSSGEYGLLKIMGRFNAVESMLRLNGDYKDVLVSLDEPEVTFHPEWQRNMVTFLNSYFSEIYYRKGNVIVKSERNRNIQIILTSHSPFVASDLPRENMIMLDTYDEEDEETKKDEKDPEYQNIGNCKVVKNKEIKTFGANIFDLYSDAFFVESNFGEFAKEKIKEVVKTLTYTEEKNENEIKRVYNDGNPVDEEKISYIIDSIGEKLVKNKLQKIYDEYRNHKASKEYKKEQLKLLMKKTGLKNKEIEELLKNGELND